MSAEQISKNELNTSPVGISRSLPGLLPEKGIVIDQPQLAPSGLSPETGGVPRRGIMFSPAREVYARVNQLRVIAEQVQNGPDEQTRRLVTAALQERLEAKYLEGLRETDKQRVYTLRQQVIETSHALSEVLGHAVTLPNLYTEFSKADPEQYPALNTPNGLIAFFEKFYPNIVSRVLSASEIASEKAEVRAQLEEAIDRSNLDTEKAKLEQQAKRVEIGEKASTADKLIKNGDTLKKAEKLKGEIDAERYRAWINSHLGVVPDFAKQVMSIPMEVIKDFGKWVEENPKVAVSATLGGTTAPVAALYWMTTSPYAQAFFQQHPVGGFVGGALIVAGSGVAGATASIAITETGSRIVGKIGEWKDDLEKALSEIEIRGWKPFAKKSLSGNLASPQVFGRPSGSFARHDSLREEPSNSEDEDKDEDNQDDNENEEDEDNE